MTLRDLITEYPKFFYPQTWYLRERFIDAPAAAVTLTLPSQITPHEAPPSSQGLPCAAQLALLYISHPTDRLWTRYLWCADVDAQGQRVYVGSNGHGLEIHRHLHITSRWSIASWT
jgi:hypothetical protein